MQRIKDDICDSHPVFPASPGTTNIPLSLRRRQPTISNCLHPRPIPRKRHSLCLVCRDVRRVEHEQVDLPCDAFL